MSDEEIPLPMNEEREPAFRPVAYEPAHPVDYLKSVLQSMADHIELAEDPLRFLDHILEEIYRQLKADVALLYGWDGETKEWDLLSHRGMPKDFGKNGYVPRAWQSLPSIVLQQGPDLFSGEISKDPRFVGQVIRGMNIQSFAGTTLRSQTKVLGSLSLGFSKSDALTPRDQELFLALSKLVIPSFSRRVQAAEKKEPLSASLDMGGKIISFNAEFAQFFGYEKEGFLKTPFSRLLTPAAVALYSERVDAVKSGQKMDAPFKLDVIKKGNIKGTLSVHLSSAQRDGRTVGFDLTAEDAVEVGALEKDLLRKNIEISLFETLFSSLSRSFKEDVFKETLDKTLSLMDIEGGYLLKLDEKKQRLFLVAHKGLSGDKAQRLEKQGAKIGESVIGKVLEKKTPTLWVAEDPKTPLKKRFVGEEGLVSYIGVPIKSSNQTWGTFSLFSRTRLFSQDDLEIVGVLGKELGFAVDNMRLFDQARRQVEDLTIINEVSQSITKSLHLEQLLSSVANSLTKMIGASNCYIFAVDDKRNLLYGAAASDLKGDAIRKVEVKMNENTLVSLTAREQHSFVVENAPQDPRVNKKWLDVFKSRSLLAVPLVIKERVIGVLLLDETRYFRQFSREEIQKVVTLADQVSVAIENATLYQAVTKHMERLQTLSSAIMNIQEEERRRIAQELHDDAGQTLTGIKMSLEWVEKELNSSEKILKERVGEIKSQVGKTLEGLQRLSSELRPAILDELGLIPTLRWYIEEYTKRTGIVVHLQTTGTQKRFSAKIEILLYRIIQEALSNVAKHAQAETVILSLEKKDLHVHLYVTDDGKGFEVKRYFSSPLMIRKGLGILGMKERVELAGGTFFIDSDPGRGTRISVKVPIVKRNS